MHEDWASLPASAVLVCAAVLTGSPAAAANPSRERSTPVAVIASLESEAHLSPNRAPTCGPCCHGSPSCKDGMLGPKEINNHPPPLETGDPPTDEQAESDESADSPEGNEPNESNDSSESGESAEDTTQDERTDQVQADEAEDELITAVAPTCGPCCHGADDEMCRPQEGPPPLETPKGCAVGGEPAEDPQQALMLLGLGALGLRRRRRDRRS